LTAKGSKPGPKWPVQAPNRDPRSRIHPEPSTRPLRTWHRSAARTPAPRNRVQRARSRDLSHTEAPMCSTRSQIHQRNRALLTKPPIASDRKQIGFGHARGFRTKSLVRWLFG